MQEGIRVVHVIYIYRKLDHAFHWHHNRLTLEMLMDAAIPYSIYPQYKILLACVCIFSTRPSCPHLPHRIAVSVFSVTSQLFVLTKRHTSFTRHMTWQQYEVGSKLETVDYKGVDSDCNWTKQGSHCKASSFTYIRRHNIVAGLKQRTYMTMQLSIFLTAQSCIA